MKKAQIEKNEWKVMIEIESAERIINDGCHFKMLSDAIIHIGQKMKDRKATPLHVNQMLAIRDALDVIVEQLKNDVSHWASSQVERLYSHESMPPELMRSKTK